MYVQKARTPITLNEFMPRQLRLSKEIPLACYQVEKENELAVEETEVETQKSLQSSVCHCCVTKITFSDDDLLLGTKPHNRPLYTAGFVRGQNVSRILIDDGSAVNIIPLKTVKELGIPMDELLESRLMIQGFNQEGQRAIGRIILDLHIDGMQSSPLLHVIDSKATYNILLGRPWIHENSVVPSSLHQCFKYIKNGEVKKVVADSKPFTVAESYFADAKFYPDMTKEEEV